MKIYFERVAVAFTVFLIAAAYFLGSRLYQTGYKTFYDYEIKLADSLAAGRLYVYNLSEVQYTYPTNDLSYYNGKFYSPFGIMPSLVIAPFRALLDGAVTSVLASVSAGLLSVFVWYGIIRSLKRNGLAGFSAFDSLLFLAMVVFGGDFLWISNRGNVWYSNQTFTFLFVSLSLLSLLQRGYTYRVLSSMFFSFAFLTRNSLLAVAPFFYLMLCSMHTDGNENPAGRLLNKKNAVLVLVFVLALGVQASYNLLRFENPLENGYSLQKYSTTFKDDISSYGMFSPHYVARNIRLYLLKPLVYRTESPYTECDPDGCSFWSYQPSLIIILIYVYHSLKRKPFGPCIHPGETPYRVSKKHLLVFFSAIWLTYLASLMFFYSAGRWTLGNRYLLDVQPFLNLLVILSYDNIRETKKYRVLSYLLVLLTISIGYVMYTQYYRSSGIL